jgi:hypothetical protein
MKYLLLFAFCLLFFGCAVQKDRKAVLRVNANSELQDKVGVVWIKLHPCINDTIEKTKTDTTMVINTVWEVQKDTIIKKITKVITIHDTLKVIVQDKQGLSILTDSINAEKRNNSFLKGQITEKEKQIKEQKKKEIYLWIALSMFLAGLITLIYQKLKPKIK